MKTERNWHGTHRDKWSLETGGEKNLFCVGLLLVPF